MRKIIVTIIIAIFALSLNAQSFIGQGQDSVLIKIRNNNRYEDFEEKLNFINSNGILMSSILFTYRDGGFQYGVYFVKHNEKMVCVQEYHFFKWESLYNAHVKEVKAKTTIRVTPQSSLNIMYNNYIEIRVNYFYDKRFDRYIIVYKDNDFVNYEME